VVAATSRREHLYKPLDLVLHARPLTSHPTPTPLASERALYGTDKNACGYSHIRFWEKTMFRTLILPLALVCLGNSAASAQSQTEIRLPDGSTVTPAPIVPGITVDGRIVTDRARQVAPLTASTVPALSEVLIRDVDVTTTGSVESSAAVEAPRRDCKIQQYDVGRSVVRVRRC
jgi:hypothetical protein